jgi:hypothetical protein
MRQLASVTSLFSTFGGSLYTPRINEIMVGYLFEAPAYQGCITPELTGAAMAGKAKQRAHFPRPVE